MSDYIIWILLLGLWGVILFFGNEFGISVLLFMIPLCLFMYNFLNKNNKIKNRNGLLYMVPIILLSCSYFLFNNELFSALNVFATVVLFTLMYIFTINPSYSLNVIINDICSLLFSPFNYVGRFYRITKYKIAKNIKLSNNTKKVLKTILIVLPISIIIIGLLSSADLMFANIFNNIFDKIMNFIKDLLLDNIIAKIMAFILISFAIGCTCMYLLFDYKNYKLSNSKKNLDPLTIKTLITVLNVIYLIFDFIQIKSLLLHRVSSGINYAEYARNGFFELMIVTFINVIIMIISKRYENKSNPKSNNYIKIMNTIMIFLTIVIISSSFIRMLMYEQAFGYTTSRVIVFVALVTEAILMIPTIMYIFNSNVNFMKSFIIITLVAYLVCNYMNIDYVVARKNVNRYYTSNKIDLDYLENYHSDNMSVLIELYYKTTDTEIKKDLEGYFKYYKDNYEEDSSIFEFNLSKYKAYKLIDSMNLKNSQDYSIYE